MAGNLTGVGGGAAGAAAAAVAEAGGVVGQARGAALHQGALHQRRAVGPGQRQRRRRALVPHQVRDHILRCHSSFARLPHSLADIIGHDRDIEGFAWFCVLYSVVNRSRSLSGPRDSPCALPKQTSLAAKTLSRSKVSGSGEARRAHLLYADEGRPHLQHAQQRGAVEDVQVRVR